MVTTLTSLPPELLLKILSYLPRPTLEHHLPTPSPLISASLVSRKLGALSQELLFRSVVLNSEEEIGRWARTQARMFTTELRLEGGIIDPIAAMEVLIRGMDSRDNSRRDGLRVLEFDTLVKGAVEGRFSWGDWVGLKELESLSISYELLPTRDESHSHKLRNLRLVGSHPIAALCNTLCANLPTVTQLTLTSDTRRLRPDFLKSFPALVHLHVTGYGTGSVWDRPAVTDALRHAPPSLTHFVASNHWQGGTHPAIFSALPSSVTDLTLTSITGLTFTRFLSHFDKEPGLLTRGALMRVTVLGREEDEVDEHWGPRAASLTRAREVGLDVTFVKELAIEWR